MEAKNILVVLPVQENHKEMLERYAPDSIFLYRTPDTVSSEELKQAQIIIGNLPPSRLSTAGRVLWVQLDSAGYDGYTAPGVLPPGAKLTNATGAYGPVMSEFMIGVILGLQKHLPLYHRHQQDRQWKPEGPFGLIQDSRTLVIGLGNIGGEFARRMHSLGSRVTGIRRRLVEKPDYLEELCQMDALERLLPQADIVALTLPATPDTRHIINRKMLDIMKDNAILINVGRGSAIDTQALCAVLDNGKFMGVGLDVTDPEPLPPEHPLWDYPNVVITPHIAGKFNQPETLDRIVRIASENLMRFMNQRELRNEIAHRGAFS